MVRYISRDLDWTDSMKDRVEAKIIAPLKRYLHSANFDLSVRFEMDRKRTPNRSPEFELWAVLQTYDGRGNEIVRRRGAKFQELIQEVAETLKAQVRKAHTPRRFSLNPFRWELNA